MSDTAAANRASTNVVAISGRVFTTTTRNPSTSKNAGRPSAAASLTALAIRAIPRRSHPSSPTLPPGGATGYQVPSRHYSGMRPPYERQSQPNLRLMYFLTVKRSGGRSQTAPAPPISRASPSPPATHGNEKSIRRLSCAGVPPTVSSCTGTATTESRPAGLMLAACTLKYSVCTPWSVTRRR